MHDIVTAFGILTRWPMPGGAASDDDRPAAAAAWAFPVVGLWVALVAVVAGWVAATLGAPAVLVAGLVLAALIVQTGGLHEDGLADCADGFWGGATRERRLEIMRDSRIGAFGTLALALSVVVRFALLLELARAGGLAAGVGAAAVLSRVPMAFGMAWLPNARGGGFAASVGAPARQTAVLGLGAGLVIALALAGLAVLPALAWVSVAAAGTFALARVNIGGHSGDVLGAAQVLGEIAALSVFVAAWT